MNSTPIKTFLVLRDEDIFPNPINSHTTVYDHTRVAVKAILINYENKIALVGIKNRLLPGGGVEESESLGEAMKRECLEECGYEVEVLYELGIIEEYRAKRKGKQQSHCFVAKVTGGNGIPSSMQEDEKDMTTEWFSLDEAIETLKAQVKTISFESYNSCFNVRAHLVFLEEFKKIIN